MDNMKRTKGKTKKTKKVKQFKIMVSPNPRIPSLFLRIVIFENYLFVKILQNLLFSFLPLIFGFLKTRLTSDLASLSLIPSTIGGNISEEQIFSSKWNKYSIKYLFNSRSIHPEYWGRDNFEEIRTGNIQNFCHL